MTSDADANADDWLAIEEDLDVAAARGRVRQLGLGQGLSHAAIEALATATTEIARNILVHARAGELSVRAVQARGKQGLAVVARDRGPGILDLEVALTDGYTTKDGLGLGLPGARRLVDEFDIQSQAGEGTVVTLRKWAL